jgi:hypothetical protein
MRSRRRSLGSLECNCQQPRNTILGYGFLTIVRSGKDSSTDVDLLALHKAVERDAPVCASLVKLRYFAGLGHGQDAEIFGLARRRAHRHWAFARAWLFDQLRRGKRPSRSSERLFYRILAQLGRGRSTER